jgi:YggT family protein
MIWIVLRLIDLIFLALDLIILARVFLPLLGADPYHPLVRFVYIVTEPVLAPLRRWTIAGQWDFSPLVVLIALSFIQQIVTQLVFYVLA